MKILYIFMLFITTLSIMHRINCCPTCVGRMKKDAPLMFDDEFYKTNPQDEIDDVEIEEYFSPVRPEPVEGRRGIS